MTVLRFRKLALIEHVSKNVALRNSRQANKNKWSRRKNSENED